MKVRTLIRQLAMHDMDSEVWLDGQPQVVTEHHHVVTSNEQPRLIVKVDKQRASFGKIVYLQGKLYGSRLAGSAANEVSPRTATEILESNKNYIGDLERSRKLREIPPEAGKPANAFTSTFDKAHKDLT